MKTMPFKNRNIVASSVEIEFGKEAEESFIRFAYSEDCEDPLSDDELDELTEEYADFIHEEWIQHKICEAEYLAERDR